MTQQHLQMEQKAAASAPLNPKAQGSNLRYSSGFHMRKIQQISLAEQSCSQLQMQKRMCLLCAQVLAPEDAKTWQQACGNGLFLWLLLKLPLKRWCLFSPRPLRM